MQYACNVVDINQLLNTIISTNITHITKTCKRDCIPKQLNRTDILTTNFSKTQFKYGHLHSCGANQSSPFNVEVKDSYTFTTHTQTFNCKVNTRQNKLQTLLEYAS